MNCIKKIKIDNTIYEANVDFRNAIQCNKIATDKTIGDTERALGIICTMFGEHGLDNPIHYEKLLKWTIDYLSCGEEIKQTNENPDMDYIEDEKYIKSSFKYDYHYNPYDMKSFEWQDFYNDLNNLSNSELGNCCILNRVRYWRNLDLSKIQDLKEREKARKTKEYYSLKKNKKENEVTLTNKQQNSVDEFYKALGF